MNVKLLNSKHKDQCSNLVKICVCFDAVRTDEIETTLQNSLFGFLKKATNLETGW